MSNVLHIAVYIIYFIVYSELLIISSYVLSELRKILTTQNCFEVLYYGAMTVMLALCATHETKVFSVEIVKLLF